MGIKERIDGLNEQEAKAVLEWVLMDDALGRISVGVANVENTMEHLLNRALWEVRK